MPRGRECGMSVQGSSATVAEDHVWSNRCNAPAQALDFLPLSASIPGFLYPLSPAFLFSIFVLLPCLIRSGAPLPSRFRAYPCRAGCAVLRFRVPALFLACWPASEAFALFRIFLSRGRQDMSYHVGFYRSSDILGFFFICGIWQVITRRHGSLNLFTTNL